VSHLREGADVRKRPKIENLMFPKMMHVIGDVAGINDWKSETLTAPALHPIMRGILNPKSSAWVTFALLSRTAILFVVDHDEFAEVAGSAGEAPVREFGLPPLPFPRVVAECSEDVTWALHDNNGEWTFDLELFMINEQISGEKWNVVMLLRKADTYDDPEQYLFLYDLYADGSVIFYQRGTAHPNLDRLHEAQTREELIAALDELRDTNLGDAMHAEKVDPDDEHAILARKTVVEFAHLVSARGVTVEHLNVPRPQRRRFERKRIVHPQVYFVFIDDEEMIEYDGRSDREYHCRWMVRGHWRHFRSGDRIWIRPYIKGPAGAPWKGRPIYVLTGDA